MDWASPLKAPAGTSSDVSCHCGSVFELDTQWVRTAQEGERQTEHGVPAGDRDDFCRRSAGFSISVLSRGLDHSQLLGELYVVLSKPSFLSARNDSTLHLSSRELCLGVDFTRYSSSRVEETVKV